MAEPSDSLKNVLQPRLKDAVDAWCSTHHLGLFRLNWSGSSDGSDGNQQCVALVQYARSVGCDPNDEVLANALRELQAANHIEDAIPHILQDNSDALSLENFNKGQQQQFAQAANLMVGLIETVSAAVEYRRAGNNVSREAAAALGKAAKAYSDAWPFSKPLSLGASDLHDRAASGTSILAVAARHTEFGGNDHLTASTWLILRRLLATLLPQRDVERDPRPLWSNTMRMLLYGVNDRDRNRPDRGYVCPVRVEAAAEGQWAFYPDPLAFGVTVIDESMQTSLALAWRTCVQSVRANSNAVSGISLRLIPEFPLWVPRLEGGSACGLIACTMYATAVQKNLDSRRTATCSLRLADGAPTDGDLEPEQVTLSPIGRLPAKWSAVCETDIVEVVLMHTQAEAWNSSHPAFLPPPEVTGASTLAELYARLEGNPQSEDLLERHAAIVAGEWDRILDAVPGSDAPEQDRNLNATHRFDCYVSPTYRIERPRRREDEVQLQQRERTAVEEPGQDDDQSLDAAVPGSSENASAERKSSDDESLLNLLGMMHETTVWDGAPDWLREAQQRGSRSLVGHDNAGSGKTVFSFRLRHVAAGADSRRRFFKGRAPLVIRWEGEWPHACSGGVVDETKPLNVEEALAQQMAEDLGRAFRKPDQLDLVRQCVRYALDRRRVIVILDGFDQFSPGDRLHVRDLLAGQPHGDKDALACRWVITGRVHVIEERADLFDDARFARVRIDPFTPEQQDDYFKQRRYRGDNAIIGRGSMIGRHWLKVIGIHPDDNNEDTVDDVPERMDELTRLPMTLWLIGELIDLNPKDQPLPTLRTLSALALRVSRELLKRALTLNLDAIEEKLKKAKIDPITLTEREQLQLLERVLTLISFQLMLEANYNGRVVANDMPDFVRRCRDRWFHDLDAAEAQSGLSSRQKRELEEDSKKADHYWNWALAVLETIELNYRTVTERYGRAGLALRSRKIVECHAARYLTKYATDWDVFADGNNPQCAFRFSNDPEWTNCWNLAIEMPRIVPSDPDEGLDQGVTLHSLSALLRPPQQGARPTELIYRAWHLLEIDDLLVRQRQFELKDGRLVYGEELSQAERATKSAELVLSNANAVVDEYRRKLREVVDSFETVTGDPEACCDRQQNSTPEEKSRWFVQCPPQAWIDEYEDDKQQPSDQRKRPSDPCIGVMGADDGEEKYEDERPRHRVRIEPFQIQATLVTRAQYALFDAACEKEHRDKHSQDPDQPVHDISWFDAFAYAKWLGKTYRLPTECEWEFACRAGTEKAFHFGPALNGKQANCNGNHPYGTEEKVPYLGKTTPAGTYPPNKFGLYDVHGNLWEWCWDWFDAGCYRTRKEKHNANGRSCAADAGPPSGSSGRVLRGGSWYNDAIDCRSAARRHGAPVVRNGFIGLRVARSY